MVVVENLRAQFGVDAAHKIIRGSRLRDEVHVILDAFNISARRVDEGYSADVLVKCDVHPVESFFYCSTCK